MRSTPAGIDLTAERDDFFGSPVEPEVRHEAAGADPMVRRIENPRAGAHEASNGSDAETSELIGQVARQYQSVAPDHACGPLFSWSARGKTRPSISE